MTLSTKTEQAASASRELDAAIFQAVRPDEVPTPIVQSGYGWRFTRGYWWCETGEDQRTPRKKITPPAYTTSLDAAMTLVPEGWGFNVSQPNEKAIDSGLLRTDSPCMAEVQYGGDQRFIVAASTPALALCAAALKAQGL